MQVSTSVERVGLPLSVPFEIARGETRETEVVLLEVADGTGERGVGAAAPSAYYGETVEDVVDVLPDLLATTEEWLGRRDRPARASGTPGGADHLDAAELAPLETRLAERAEALAPDSRVPAARAAVSCAVWDLLARRAGAPLYDVWDLDPTAVPPMSYTVSIAAPDAMAERARALVEEGFEVLKVKLGTDADRERLEAVRAAAPEATIRVDANGAWDAERAVANADWLADADVEFLEQPVAGDDLAGLRRVHEQGAVPVAADESCPTAADVPAVADATDVVVVKLMKCGGIGPARRAIEAAHEHGCAVLLGCMVESNASIAPACHLAPLVEHVDLDGALLLASDPYDGVPMPGGRIDLGAVERGSGAVPR